MSRYTDYNDDGEVPPEFWDMNVRRALRGKRGQKMLRELRDALLALPEPRLIADALCTVGAEQRVAKGTNATWLQSELAGSIEENGGEGVCALGAWLWHKRVLAGMDPAEAFASLPEHLEESVSETARLAVDAGSSFTLAWELAAMNDDRMKHYTPEVRYQKFIEWIDLQLAPAGAST